MKQYLKINKEYLLRHLFFIAVMIGLSLWFAYDGAVAYPSMTPTQLYVQIEGSEPVNFTNEQLVAFKAQKINSQYGFAFATLFAALIVGLRLWRASRWTFAYDEEGFDFEAHHCQWSDVKSLNDAQWQKKRCFSIVAKDKKIFFDAWHHTGVNEVYAKISSLLKQADDKTSSSTVINDNGGSL